MRAYGLERTQGTKLVDSLASSSEIGIWNDAHALLLHPSRSTRGHDEGGAALLGFNMRLSRTLTVRQYTRLTDNLVDASAAPRGLARAFLAPYY